MLVSSISAFELLAGKVLGAWLVGLTMLVAWGGAGFSVAVGAALSAQMRGSEAIALAFCGDGATNIGTFHEALNMAAVWKAPVVFVIENNLFQGPIPLTANEVDVTCNQDHATIDYDSYNTDGQFAFTLNGVYTRFPNFANLQSTSPLEHHGQILTAVCPNGSVFTSCLLPPANNQTLTPAQDVTPGSGSGAFDKAVLLPNVNDQFVGAGPDVGAVESGCVQPIYGPRPVGLDENKVYTCNGYQ